MSAAGWGASGELKSILGELQALLLAPGPEALERAAELALTLRGPMGRCGEETLRAIDVCRKLAQQAADYYLRLQETLERGSGTYTARGDFRALEGRHLRLDARA
jgi:hypothetical protein